MKPEETISFLASRLAGSLPGEEAHRRMKPRLSSGAPLRISHAAKPRKGAVLILLYADQGVLRFPIIQRQSYEGIHSGQMALPGGGFEGKDQSLTDTALRETHEEIGVEQSDVRVLGSLSKFYVAASNYDILPVVGYTPSVPKLVPDPTEVASIHTPPLADLLEADEMNEKVMMVRNGLEMICPYFELEGKVVWGATSMMLNELRAIFGEKLIKRD